MAKAETKSKAKSKQDKAPKASSAKAVEMPDVPEVVQTDEFHLPVQDNSPGTIRSNDRLVKIIILIAVLVAVGVIYILISHDSPVETS